MVLFSGEAWCVPCQRFRPHFDRAAQTFDHAEFIHVNVDEADPELLTEYAIQSVPTVYAFNHGQLKGPINGRTIMSIVPEIEAIND